MYAEVIIAVLVMAITYLACLRRRPRPKGEAAESADQTDGIVRKKRNHNAKESDDDSPEDEEHEHVGERGASIPGLNQTEHGHGHLIKEAGGLVPFIKSLHAQYGPIAKFYLDANVQVVSCNDPELIKKTLRFSSRPRDLFRFLEPIITADNLQIFDGQRAKKMRQLLGSPVGHAALRHKYYDVLKHALATVRDLDNKPDGATVSIVSELLKFGLRSIFCILSGSEEEVDFDRFQQAYDDALSGSYDSQFGISDTDKQRLDDSVAFIKEIVFKLIRDKKAKSSSALVMDDSDFLETLLYSDDPTTGEPFKEEMIYSLFVSYILAAYHTSIVATSWALYLLTQHPSVYKKVQQEIDTVLNGHNPEAEQLEQLAYTTQAIKEAMRVYTPGPFAARLVDKDARVGRYRLTKGTTLFYPLSVVHKNADLWPDPEIYDPDRFAPENVNNIPRGAYIPFGVGSRSCPGDRVAWMEMRLLLALLLQKFDFELAMDPADVVPIERFVLWPKNDIKLRITHRE